MAVQLESWTEIPGNQCHKPIPIQSLPVPIHQPPVTNQKHLLLPWRWIILAAMVMKFITKIFGTSSDREMKRFAPMVDSINSHYADLENATHEDLLKKTANWQERIRIEREALQAELQQEDRDDKQVQEKVYELEESILDEIKFEAFAVVKRGAALLMNQQIKVTGQDMLWDMIPYDVQLIGGLVLHEGKISEMKTGEGKTLVATMPIYLNALVGKGVHVITVNDYLAQRDSQWMGSLLEYLGLSVGVILNEMDPDERRQNYNCDVTYGINSEFGFDYLRDNMSISKEDQVQRGHHFAIVDEVDSVLIDEARTPLIISGVVESQIQQRYFDLRPMVDSIVRKQSQLVNTILSEAESKLDQADTEYEAGILLLRARRGSPKNRKLLKLYEKPGIKKLEQRVENDFMRDKRMPEIDDELFYVIEERQNVVDLTEKGRQHLSPNNPEMFVIPDLSTELQAIDAEESLTAVEKTQKRDEIYSVHGERSDTIHNLSQLLKAYSLFEKDVDYVVQGGKVLIVDEFTGRIMHGRRYSDGLHQALEAKEKVQIEKESQTLATITLQNYFRLYSKLAGMTGTAMTEAEEFFSIYKLLVVEIPTHQPVIREDHNDQIYKTRREKFNAVIEEIVECNRSGQPVLVGTVSVEVSETLSRMLKRLKVPHNVLNAKHHEREAEIVARAGQPHAVTIATNMAGRGTDIKLGPGVQELGGLRIIGTERHESRRIDLQLRGRSGRQGDPGNSRFYLSLEDDLMRLFAAERVAAVMDRMGLQDGEVIEAKMVTSAVERAQKKVEGRNFSIRKHLLEYDNVMNQQREVVYDRRQNAIEGVHLEDEYREVVENYVDAAVELCTGGESADEFWDWDALNHELGSIVMLQAEPDSIRQPTEESLRDYLLESIWQAYKSKAEILGTPENLRRMQQFVYLRVIDEKWREHLYDMDQMKEGINLRAVGQKDPLIEYKREGYEMFVTMLDGIDRDILKLYFHARIVTDQEARQRRQRSPRNMASQHADSTGMGMLSGLPQAPPEGAQGPPPPGPPQPSQKQKPVRVEEKVGRNDPCPCGSGKKFKKCHGQNA